MSAKKATLESVLDASKALLSEGERVTLTAVVSRTLGSRTTVGRHLKECRQQLEVFLAEGLDLPIGMRDLLLDFERTVWKEARLAASAAFGQERDTIHRLIHEGNRELEELADINAKLQQALETTLARLASAAVLLERRSEDLDKANKIADDLRTRAADGDRGTNANEIILKEIARIRQRLDMAVSPDQLAQLGSETSTRDDPMDQQEIIAEIIAREAALLAPKAVSI